MKPILFNLQQSMPFSTIIELHNIYSHTCLTILTPLSKESTGSSVGVAAPSTPPHPPPSPCPDTPLRSRPALYAPDSLPVGSGWTLRPDV